MSAPIVLNHVRTPMEIDMDRHHWLMDGDYACIRIKVQGQLWQRLAEGKKR